MAVSADQAQDAYRRLLAGEPDASGEVIELFLDALVRTLGSRYPNLPDPDLVIDTVIDTLFTFVQDPSRYDPARGALWTYLYIDADGDIRNAIARQKKHWNHSTFDPAVHDAPDRSINPEKQVVDAIVPDGLPEGMNLQEVIATVRASIDDPRDREVLGLMLSGERKSEAFSRVLGIAHMTPLEQRRIVKQRKDRIDARLRRLGERIRNERSI